MFHRLVESQLDRVRECPQAGMLGATVYIKLEDSLQRKAEFVASSTVTHMVAQVAAADNPFAAALPDLLTKEEKDRALTSIQQQLDAGVLSLPEPLVACLEQQLGNTTNAFIEALGRLTNNRDALCDALLEGRRFQTIDDVDLSTGDTHNCGRSVTVFVTDAGKLVYKPHDLHVDGQVYDFVQRFFGEFVGIPRSIAFGDQFGFCEFIEKRRAKGGEEAERFWHAFGGLTAFAKLLGSTDLHYQNILCCGAKPYIIDLETMMSPVLPEREAYAQVAKTSAYQMHSPISSLIMPARINDHEISPLTNTSENGIAPIVDGKIVTVRPYLSAFKEGYHAAYARVVEQREAIREAVLSFAPTTPIRIILRPTRGYCLMLAKLNHHSALASPQSRERCIETLTELLRTSGPDADASILSSEVAQLRRGDVPYFYTQIGGLSLYADGEELARGRFSTSATEHMLDILSAMNAADESFDLCYIDGAIRLYFQQITTQEAAGPSGLGGVGGSQRHEVAGTPLRREVTKSPMRPEDAAAEAKAVLNTMFDLGIQLPNGRLVWEYTNPGSHSLVFGGSDLFDGLTGLAVFASACAHVWHDDQVRERADVLIQEATDEIRGLCQSLQRYEGDHSVVIPAGEGTGLGGILTGIALMRRYAPRESLDELCEQVLSVVEHGDFSDCTVADRIGGLAGLVSVLCRFDEYRGCTTAIRSAAERMLELKTLAYRDYVLWKTLTGVPRALSGAGHGMSGIAEALIAAAWVLDEDRYLPAAIEALEYEVDAHERYAHRYGTWADLRDFPPKRYMHGYCAGAPGTGIMLNRIANMGGDGVAARSAAWSQVQEQAHALAELTRASIDKLPLNPYDHLCCGNAAIAEYYLCTGSHADAGRVLGALYERSQREGSYRDATSGASGNVVASLFNGISGIGYEMLRYAYPQAIRSIL